MTVNSGLPRNPNIGPRRRAKPKQSGMSGRTKTRAMTGMWNSLGVLIFVILLVQMVPLIVLVIPVYLTLGDLHARDTLWGIVLTYLVFTVPYTVWTLRGFIANIPRELDEAALVDGCNRWQTFVRIILPLTGPGLVATSVYGFIQAWNEFILITTINHDKTKQNMMAWLVDTATGSRGADWGVLMAGAVKG